MNWTTILAAAGIPEPPGRQEIVEQMALLKEVACVPFSDATKAAIATANGIVWRELVILVKAEYKGQDVVRGDVMDRLLAYGGAKGMSDKQRSSVWSTVEAREPGLMRDTGRTGRSVNPNNRGHKYPIYRVAA